MMEKREKVLGVIPARWHSSRFPGKPLVDIGGKPMIQHVYERACEAKLIDDVVIATDDERIEHAVAGFGGIALMTGSDISTGTDRVAEVAKRYQHDIILNIQGDEPLITPGMLDDLVGALLENPNIPVATPVKPITAYDELIDTTFARIVMTKDRNILYFTRSVIPFARDVARQPEWIENHAYYRHVGIYCFRREFLLRFVEMEQSSLEIAERLEQLRILENGYPIRGVLTTYTPHSVDTPEDLETVREKYFRLHAESKPQEAQ